MKKVLLIAMLVIFSESALNAQTQHTGMLKGRVVDVAGMPIPKVRITILSSTDSFRVVSDEDGFYKIQVPLGSYQIISEELPGFTATKQTGVQVEADKTVVVNIVPAVSSRGVLCSLLITDGALRKQKRRKRHR
jgi:hypothetical protein